MRRSTDETWAGRTVSRAFSYQAVKPWLVIVGTIVLVRQEIIWWTDHEFRRSLIQSVPEALEYVASVGGSAATLIGIGTAIWHYLIRRRPHNERSTDR